MPPQQSERLLGLFYEVFDFGTHFVLLSVLRFEAS